MVQSIVNFAVWPDFNQASFDICLRNTTAITKKALVHFFRNRKIAKRPVNVVENFEPNQCQVVFMGDWDPQIVATLERRQAPVLLFSQKPDGAREGAHINFFRQDNKVRFEINTDALSRSRVKLSSQVLSIATIVRDRDA